jgi:hypothetical protein
MTFNNVVESGKQEINGYMLGQIQRAGLQTLTNAPLQLDNESD